MTSALPGLLPTYLLTWNPNNWEEEKLRDYIRQFDEGQQEQQWGCGGTKTIPKGSRFFLMRQGSGAKGGIFASGEIISEPFSAAHYNREKQREGRMANYVQVRFDRFFDPTASIKITVDEMEALHRTLWRVQGSGKLIPEDVAMAIEELWLERIEA